MKKIVEVTEVAGQGLESLLGENVLILCGNYFYKGKLTGVNTTVVELENASIVYETGWSVGGKQDSFKLPTKVWYVQTSFIESFGLEK